MISDIFTGRIKERFAKMALLSSPNPDPETARIMTNKYQALERLIKWMERKLNELCAED